MRTRPPGTFWVWAALTTDNPKSPRGRWLRHRSLALHPQNAPSWLCHRVSPLPALQETEAGLPITTSSGFQLISGHFLPISSIPGANPSEQWVSLLRRDTGPVRGQCVSLPILGHRDSHGVYGQDEDKLVSYSSSKKREYCRLQSRGRTLSWIKLPAPACCHLWLHFLLQA